VFAPEENVRTPVIVQYPDGAHDEVGIAVANHVACPCDCGSKLLLEALRQHNGRARGTVRAVAR
jgi:hypothetical protein